MERFEECAHAVSGDMGREITQDLAEKIRDKLCHGEKPKTAGAHDVYAIRHAGQVVGRVSIRRSSKQIGHDYIPREINVSMRFAKEIGICTKNLADYIECLRSKGLIAREPEPTLPPPRIKQPWEKDWVAIQDDEAKESSQDPEPDSSGE